MVLSKLPLGTVCKVAMEIYRSCSVHVYRGHICKPWLKMCRNEHCASFWYFLWAINLSWFACHRCVSFIWLYSSCLCVVDWVYVQWYCSTSSPPYAYGSSFLSDYITCPQIGASNACALELWLGCCLRLQWLHQLWMHTLFRALWKIHIVILLW